MRLEHHFRVPAPLPDVWTAVLDPERVAPCMPGATLTSVDADAFTGTVKVKLGPVSLTYKGKGEFLTRDETARRVVIKASGKDSHGNGTAAATVTLTLTADGDSTIGQVETDLSITGKPAQFGRGLISEVGGKILDTFAECLSRKLAPAAEPDNAPEPAGHRPSGGGPEPTPRTGTPDRPQDRDDQPGEADGLVARQPSGRDHEPMTANGSPLPQGPAAEQLSTTDIPAPRDSTAGDREPAVADRPAPVEETADQASNTGEHAPGTEAPATPPLPDEGDQGEQSDRLVARGPADASRPPQPTGRPALAAVPDRENEPIDLMEFAGRSVVKRVAPAALGLIALAAVVAAIIRKRA